MLQRRYITIDMDIKRQFDISLNEYSFLEVISKLSNNSKYKWCEANREDLAQCVDLSKKAVNEMVNRLVDKNLLERDSRGKIKTSMDWEEAVSTLVPNRHDSVGKKLPQLREETTPPTKGENKGEKGNTKVLPSKAKEKKGIELTNLLEELKTILNLDAWAEPHNIQRMFGNHIMRKYGREDAIASTKLIIERWGDQYKPTTTRSLYYGIAKIKERTKEENSFKQY